MKYRIRREVRPDYECFFAEETDWWWPFRLIPEAWDYVGDCPEVQYGNLSRCGYVIEAAKANIDFAIESAKRQKAYLKKCKTEYVRYP